jgi:hypothetical protein
MQIKISLISCCLSVSFAARAQDIDPHAPTGDELFQTSSQCIACHSGLTGPDGADVSIGTNWRASMMANAARDPYWHAAVRREVTDHPEAQAAIEDKCSTCHMPMAHVAASAAGGLSEVFANIATMQTEPDGHLAADGVSCTVCHQIEPTNFGSEESFTGGFVIDTTTTAAARAIYGPHEVDAGRQRLMQSASLFLPQASDHLKQSEMCATCHTLYTHALDDQGSEVGELAEQVPYLEWLASDFRETQSCQDCHMPVLAEDTPISSVLGQPRPEFSQHVFRGGNSFMLSILNKYRNELGVTALPQEFDATIRRTKQFLANETARLSIDSLRRTGGELVFDVSIESLAGHKLPTAYPSRRAWLHVTVTGADGSVLFESGAVRDDGSIVGNANDGDTLSYEPHYEQITNRDQVQIYEPILVDWRDRVTTGLLYGVRYIKDNRLLPRGFDKASADADVAVNGAARDDADFTAGGDRIRYRLPITAGEGLRIDVELLFQSIGYRWAENLADYRAAETERFVGYYRDTIAGSAVRLASDSVSTN